MSHFSGVQRDTWTSLLAEIHSCQMEYKYLAHLTGRQEYFDAASFNSNLPVSNLTAPLLIQVNNVTNVLEALQQKQLADPANLLGGMLPTHYMVKTGEPSDRQCSIESL
jgi:hypothetical protein